MESEPKFDFLKFYNSLPSRSPTENMMKWMRFYTIPCDRLCCFSPDCGCIRCSSCGISLTRLPPSLRYQCIECPVLPPEAPYNPKPELCSSCFYDSRVLHNHCKWMKISENGAHSLEIREKGLCELKSLDITRDFELSKCEEANDCYICTCEFDESNKAVKFPGCKKDHGSALKDKEKGVIDSRQYPHKDCLLKWLEMSFQEKYCGEPKYCEMCNFEEEMQGWRKEFQEAKKEIEKVKDEKIAKGLKSSLGFEITEDELKEPGLVGLVKEKLLKMHPQIWIQNLIQEVFGGC